MSTNTLVAKIWSFCDTLRDDGVSYGDYLEQITYLLFLKMADEYASMPDGRDYNIPSNCDWKSILTTDIKDLPHHYITILSTLSESGNGMLHNIYNGAQNKIHDPFKLKRLIDLINEESWVTESVDIKGDIYESLLQKNAESSGAGQYFTPRSVIETIIECIRPKPLETISDPSCGTGGFFLGALNFIRKENISLTLKEEKFLKFNTFHGWEIVPSTARLCLMNLFLHGIGDLKTTPEIEVSDSLKDIDNKKVKIVVANPPFGKSSSDIPTNDKRKAKQDGYYYRDDFWVTTSNKQLGFLQHIVTMLNDYGRAAVVLPDNILFEGGAGETVRKELLKRTNLHTILRLPTGIFYAQGVKSNVLFFDNKPPSIEPQTKKVWFYDYRTNIRHTPKKNPLKFEHLEEFIHCYNPEKIDDRTANWNEESSEGRWRSFTYEEILARDKTNMDIFWLKDDSLIDLDNLPEPDVLLTEIIDNIESALENFKTIRETLN